MTLPANICESCGGEGTLIEFRRFAGEYQAGEPIEVECHECGGEGSWDDEPEVCRVCATVLIDGVCSICDAHLHLTETVSDPLLKRRAA